MGEIIKGLKIKSIVFDCLGYIYYGRVKVFVDVVRLKGVKF